MITNFKCKETKKLHQHRRSRVPQSIQRSAQKALDILDAAIELEELRSPAGNHLHQLKGDRAHQHAIRVNDQYRLCFDWNDGNPTEVAIIDYH